MSWKHILIAQLLVQLLWPAVALAASRGSNKEAPPPQIYTKKYGQILDALTAEEVASDTSPFTLEQQDELRELLTHSHKMAFDQPNTLKVTNKDIPLSLRERKVVEIKLGHTYTTTVVFTDSMGNPWSVDTLSDVSNSDVVSMVHPAPHILSFRPQKKSGQTNLPVKLSGEQYPITLLFDINEDEVYFNVDVKADGLGDHKNSQRAISMQAYTKGDLVPPKLNADPAKELMLQFLTPEGYAPKHLKDEYGERVDPRDFTAWAKDGKLYVITPHDHYSPAPIDISAASDGRHRLFEFVETSVIMMRRNSQVMMIHIE